MGRSPDRAQKCDPNCNVALPAKRTHSIAKLLHMYVLAFPPPFQLSRFASVRSLPQLAPSSLRSGSQFCPDLGSRGKFRRCAIQCRAPTKVGQTINDYSTGGKTFKHGHCPNDLPEIVFCTRTNSFATDFAIRARKSQLWMVISRFSATFRDCAVSIFRSRHNFASLARMRSGKKEIDAVDRKRTTRNREMWS